MKSVEQSTENPESTWGLGTGIRQRFGGVLAATPTGGPIVVAAVGGGLGAVTARNFLRELRLFGFQWPQVAALILGVWLSAILIYGGIYLAGTDFDARQRWLVAGTTLSGLVLVYLTSYFTFAVRMSAGQQVGQPMMQLLASAHAGAIAGFVIGVLYVAVRRDARQARQVGEQLEFMHGILRHDVLNSMTVVQSRAEYLDTRLNGQYDESITAIQNQAESVIDLSQRARATVEALASDAEVTPEPVDLTSVLRSEAETIRGSYEDVTVRVSIPEAVAVLADGMLAAVFGNLLDNAVHHNDGDDPHIRVSVSTRGETVVTKIADNGPGIPDEEKQAVFERGYSSSSGGFGLFFVSTMVSEYGGSVAIEDNDPQGTVFVVELPVAESMPSSTLDEVAV